MCVGEGEIGCECCYEGMNSAYTRFIQPAIFDLIITIQDVPKLSRYPDQWRSLTHELVCIVFRAQNMNYCTVPIVWRKTTPYVFFIWINSCEECLR